MINFVFILIHIFLSSAQAWALPQTIKIQLERHQSHLNMAQKEQINDFFKTYHHQKVFITGHSEDGGSTQYNLILSYQRAQSALEQIKLNHVPADMIFIQGAGSNRNQAPGSLLMNNRYIEINLMEESL